MKYIDFERINSLEVSFQLRMASVIIADDGDTQAVLFEELKPGGSIIAIELMPGQVLLEGPSFCDACWAVNLAKGSCRFNPGKPIAIEFDGEPEPTNRIASFLDCDCDDWDDCGWNGGQN